MMPSDFVSGRTVVGEKSAVFGAPDNWVRRFARGLRNDGHRGSRFRAAAASEQPMDKA